MRIWSIITCVFLCLSGYSQTSLNSYKYVVVPAKYDFSRDDDQYGLNTTTKLLLEKKGFIVVLGNQALPLAATNGNRCVALRADVQQRKALFTTNLTLILKDCQGNIVFRSKEGKSREKEFPAAYDEALRGAFVSLNEVAYQYDSTLDVSAQTAAVAPASTSVPATTAAVPATTAAAAATQPGAAMTQSAAAATTQPGTAATTATATSPTANPAPVVAVGEITGMLYAQPTANGYQLVDMTPKKVLSLLKTSAPDYYIADGSNGIVFKKDNAWWFEHYEQNKLVSRKLEIKF